MLNFKNDKAYSILNWIHTMLLCQNVVSMQIKSFLLNKINKFGWVSL